MEMSKGMRVEACCDEEGYRGAYFEGTVIGLAGTGHLKIQYDKFVTEDKKGLPLVENVSSNLIRPIPPYAPLPQNSSIGDTVEAYDNDCWWRGIVVKKLAEELMFVVYFPGSQTIKAYARSELRPAQAWLGGEKWTCSFERIFKH